LVTAAWLATPAQTAVIDPGLGYSTRLGPVGTDVAAVAVDRDGHAYVAGTSRSPGYPTTHAAFEAETERAAVGFVTKLTADGSDLVYSTYLGSGITGMALDADGNVYVVGTARSDFPTTPGAYRETTTKAVDSFVAKLNPTGSALVYGTFLGGTYLGGSAAPSIAVDQTGAAYVTASTNTPDHPLTPGAFDSTLDHFPEGAVSKLDPTGSSLVYSTFYGGAYSNAIAVDRDGNAYVTGSSPSPQDFPTTAAAFDRTPNGGWDTFVTKFDAAASPVYSTLLGGPADDWSDGVAVDHAGHAYITGTGLGFPVTPGAFDTTATRSGFVAKLAATGSSLSYATGLGGNARDEPNAIDLDQHGCAYVTGLASSVDFPVTPDAYQSTLDRSQSSPDAFVTKLTRDGAALGYSTFFGGGSFEQGNGIAVDRRGDAYFIGEAGVDTPTSEGAYDTTGVEFVAKLDIGQGARRGPSCRRGRP
jgi:hypothetical protein